jgi:topoisomerase-4 subunit A
VFISRSGVGSALILGDVQSTKKNGRRVAKIKEEDELVVALVTREDLVIVSRTSYAVRMPTAEVPSRDTASQGVSLININVEKGDAVIGAVAGAAREAFVLDVDSGKPKRFAFSDVTRGKRALRGNKLLKSGQVTKVRKE